MNVTNLISTLMTMPPGAEVKFYYDSDARGEIDLVWEAKSGEVILAPTGVDVLVDGGGENLPKDFDVDISTINSRYLRLGKVYKKVNLTE